MKRVLFFLAVLLTTSAVAKEQQEAKYHQDETIVIWDNNKAPHSNGLTGEAYENPPYRLVNTTKAQLYVYNADPAKATGQAVVICPGGGYAKLSMDSEGYLMAQWLAKNGVAAFVLEYRLPNGHKEVPLEDAVEAIRIVRKRAKRFNIDPTKVGIMGFSAGGHLAASASNIPPVEDRPNFAILYYPLVLANHYASSNTKSYQQLLGKGHSASEAEKFSMEKLVSKDTPPTILLLSDNDQAVSAVGSAIYYTALRYHGVKAAMYIFPEGGHGWGNLDKFSYQKEWQHLLLRWLKELK